jgi:hypothetical protein
LAARIETKARKALAMEANSADSDIARQNLSQLEQKADKMEIDFGAAITFLMKMNTGPSTTLANDLQVHTHCHSQIVAVNLCTCNTVCGAA